MATQKTSFTNWIRVFGAREHNLKSVDVALPKESLTVITGPSGSGKSSLALDVLYTEGKRRYVESLSAYARQFLGVAKKPEVDRIEGLCPAVAIEQKTVGANPRSTVGTITEIYDYLRVLFARIGRPHCPNCHEEIRAESPEAIVGMIMHKFMGETITIAAPLISDRKGEFMQDLKRLFAQGYYRFSIDGQSYRFTSEAAIDELKLKKAQRHSISLLIDVLEITPDTRSRLHEALEQAFARADGVCALYSGDQEYKYSSKRMCLNFAT